MLPDISSCGLLAASVELGLLLVRSGRGRRRPGRDMTGSWVAGTGQDGFVGGRDGTGSRARDGEPARWREETAARRAAAAPCGGSIDAARSPHEELGEGRGRGRRPVLDKVLPVRRPKLDLRSGGSVRRTETARDGERGRDGSAGQQRSEEEEPDLLTAAAPAS